MVKRLTKIEMDSRRKQYIKEQKQRKDFFKMLGGATLTVFSIWILLSMAVIIGG